jgi:hypothetical protein
MEPNQKDAPIKLREPSILGSMHISASTILSYSLVSAAAMLAFFFAFQATLIVYFSNLVSAFGSVKINLRLNDLPIGKIGLTLVCAIMLIFYDLVAKDGSHDT